MGQAFRKLFDTFFGNQEMRVTLHLSMFVYFLGCFGMDLVLFIVDM